MVETLSSYLLRQMVHSQAEVLLNLREVLA
jgi:hypothetical protein